MSCSAYGSGIPDTCVCLISWAYLTDNLPTKLLFHTSDVPRSSMLVSQTLSIELCMSDIRQLTCCRGIRNKCVDRQGSTEPACNSNPHLDLHPLHTDATQCYCCHVSGKLVESESPEMVWVEHMPLQPMASKPLGWASRPQHCIMSSFTMQASRGGTT